MSADVWEIPRDGTDAVARRVAGDVPAAEWWAGSIFSARTNRQSRFEHALADVYTMPSAGGALRRVTTWNAETMCPAWSRDGKWIYVTSDRSGAPQLWKMPAAGAGAAVQITQAGGFNAMESPDGGRIL